METVKDLIKDRDKLNSDIHDLMQQFIDKYSSVKIEGITLVTEEPLMCSQIIVMCKVDVKIN